MNHGPLALRATLVWRGEVMEDLVFDQPSKVTLGAHGGTTFTVPDVGLPAQFPIIKPGNRGYLLTLSDRMRGTLNIDGAQKDVAEFVRRGGEGDAVGGFRATPISGRDWGVIDLDDTGDYQIVFQFVAAEPKPASSWMGTGALVAFYAIWLLLPAVASGVLIWRVDAFDAVGFVDCAQIYGVILIGETVLFMAIATLVVGIWWFVVAHMESQLSYVFALCLVGAIMFFLFLISVPVASPFEWPGPRLLTGSYLITRITPPPPDPPKPPPQAGAATAQQAAPKADGPKPKATATQNDAGAAGGKGEERAKTTNPNNDKPAPPKVALFEDKNKKILDNIIDHSMTMDLSRFAGIKGDETVRGNLGAGKAASGSGVGDNCKPGTPCSGTRGDSNANGTGGGGKAHGDFVSSGKPLDTGPQRAGGTCVGPNCKGNGPKPIAVALADPSGDFGGLTADEIDRVVKSRTGLYRACYQKELNHTPGIGGKLIFHFVINGDGVVTKANPAGGSLTNAEVASCIQRTIMGLKFPAKGGVANVNYPFVFSQGG